MIWIHALVVGGGSGDGSGGVSFILHMSIQIELIGLKICHRRKNIPVLSFINYIKEIEIIYVIHVNTCYSRLTKIYKYIQCILWYLLYLKFIYQTISTRNKLGFHCLSNSRGSVLDLVTISKSWVFVCCIGFSHFYNYMPVKEKHLSILY